MNSINDIVRRLRENRILNERTDYEGKTRDELIKLSKDGDRLAFETLYKQYEGFISKMTRKYFFDNGMDEEDAYQFGAIAFWDAVESWNMKGDFEAYAGMIIKRRMAVELEKMNAEKRKTDTDAMSIDEPVGADDEGGETTLGDKLTNGQSTEEQYLGEEGAREIFRFLRDNLSETERDVIRLYIEGYKVSQIVEETGMKYKSVENSIMRVKNKLAEYLRNRESKKIRESEGSVFTDEEKQVLTSMFAKMDESCMKESSSKSLDVEISDVASELHQLVQKEVRKVMTSPGFGFPEDEVDDYSVVDITTEDEYVVVEVRAELSYDSLMELCDALNPIVSHYDEDAYFEPVTPGIINAYVSKKALAKIAVM